MRKTKVIYADDDELCHFFMDSILDKDLYSLKNVYNGFEMIKELLREEYDLIITDLEMPELDGLEAIQIIRKSKFLGGIPIMVVSSIAHGDLVKEIITAGADDCICKPFMEKDLLRKIENLVGVFV
ncbi:MAG: response regulator [Bacteroidales bacterium]|nr:response regulator [Bacteroidales bacterium]